MDRTVAKITFDLHKALNLRPDQELKVIPDRLVRDEEGCWIAHVAIIETVQASLSQPENGKYGDEKGDKEKSNSQIKYRHRPSLEGYGYYR